MVTYIEWIKLSERFTNFELDVFQIMPNHMHGIIMMKVVEATISVAQNNGVVNNGVMVSFEKYSFTNNGYFYTKEWLRRCNTNNIEIREDQSYNFLKNILLYQKTIVALTKQQD